MVDILFVVDNSGSMQDDQNILAQSFGSFIKAFREKDVDAHFGIVTTDTTAASARSGNKPYWEDGKLNGYYRPGPGNLLSKFASSIWLDSEDKNLVGHFTANVRVGTKGSGSEQGLQSIELALADAKIGRGGFNEGFLRDEAMLSLVVVSDEDNDIRDGSTPEQLIDRVKTRLGQVKGSKSRGYSCDLVINSSIPAPARPVSYPLNNYVTHPYPNVYNKAADKMGCRKLDIARDWGKDLSRIGYDIANQAEKEFKLSNKPIDGTIVVKIDGRVVPEDSTNGYVYHADRNTIELVGDALASSPGSHITVDYQYQQ
jgi:hypothetical protein